MKYFPDFGIHITYLSSTVSLLNRTLFSLPVQSAAQDKMASSLHIHKIPAGEIAWLSRSTTIPSFPPASATQKLSTGTSPQELRSILKPAPLIHPSEVALPPNLSPPIDPSKVPLPPSLGNTASLEPLLSTPGHWGDFDYDVEHNLTESEFNELPPGFPYTDWNGALCFAWEYLRNMQRLVTELMEGTGRYHGVRHTT